MEWGGLTSPTEARGRVATTALAIGEMMSHVFFPDMVSIDLGNLNRGSACGGDKGEQAGRILWSR